MHRLGGGDIISHKVSWNGRANSGKWENCGRIPSLPEKIDHINISALKSREREKRGKGKEEWLESEVSWGEGNGSLTTNEGTNMLWKTFAQIILVTAKVCVYVCLSNRHNKTDFLYIYKNNDRYAISLDGYTALRKWKKIKVNLTFVILHQNDNNYSVRVVLHEYTMLPTHSTIFQVGILFYFFSMWIYRQTNIFSIPNLGLKASCLWSAFQKLKGVYFSFIFFFNKYWKAFLWLYFFF